VWDTDEEQLTIIPLVDEMKDLSAPTLGRISARPYGIAIDNDAIYVNSNSVVATFDINTFEYKGLLDGVINTVNSHQMLRHGDYLFTCNPAVNTVGVYNLTTKQNKHYDVTLHDFIDTLPTLEHYRELDIEHVNSIKYHNGSLYILCRTYHTNKSKIIEVDADTFITKQEYTKIGKLPHNIHVTDEYIYTLGTFNGKMYKYDRANDHLTNLNVEYFYNDWYMRGMEVVDNIMYFCCSTHPIKHSKHNISNTYAKLLSMNLDTCVINEQHLPVTSPICDIKILP
jgi:hypothetical protein